MPANVNYPTANSQKTTSIWGGTDTAACDEGSYFVVTNPTPGTVIATTTSVVDDAATASATHAQNAPVMHLKNGYTATDPLGKTLYPKYLRMMLSQVPTSATTWRFAIRIGTVARYTSGGSVLSLINSSTNATNTSPSTCYFGAVLTALDPANKLVANGTVGSVIPVTLDTWTFTWGDATQPTNFLNGSASAKNVTIALAPMAIGPGGYMQFEMWGASNGAAPSWEFEMGVVERFAGL